MSDGAVLAALLLTAEGVFVTPATPLVATTVQQRNPGVPRREIPLLELSSLGRLFNALAGQRASADEGERVAAWTDFSLLVDAVVGDARTSSLAFDNLTAADTSAGPRVIVTPQITARDHVAYQLLGIGYSSREAADVVAGRITKQALDTAHNMIVVGRGREAAANYLDSQYRWLRALKAPPSPPPTLRRDSPYPFDAAIERYATLHAVDAAIVRAIITVESAFNPLARSRAGAIGLMQLMPATARALGVNPLMPEQNIEGGVRYLSELLRMFGGIELALVAYNGGPGLARRYARGEATLYGETRDYVRRVMARLRDQR